MKYQYTLHSEEPVYNGFFKFHRYQVSYETFAGGFVNHVWRECNQKGDIVAVVPFDPVRKIIILVEQFRIGMMVRNMHPWTLEIVAGFMDKQGESPIDTAARELREETGCNALSLKPLISYFPGPGGSAAKVHVFVAEINSDEALQHTGVAEEGEDIRVHTIAIEDIRALLDDSRLQNATAIIALEKFLSQLHNGSFLR